MERKRERNNINSEKLLRKEMKKKPISKEIFKHNSSSFSKSPSSSIAFPRNIETRSKAKEKERIREKEKEKDDAQEVPVIFCPLPAKTRNEKKLAFKRKRKQLEDIKRKRLELEENDKEIAKLLGDDLKELDEEESDKEKDDEEYSEKVNRMLGKRSTRKINRMMMMIRENENEEEGIEPKTIREIEKRKDKEKWFQAMREEMKSIEENRTWKLVERPNDKNVVSCKWVFKIKKDKEGKVERYKARLVARGFTQELGFDYEETFAPVAKFDSIRFLIALANEKDWEIEQMDVNTAFLYGEIDKEIFMEQPDGFQEGKEKDLVCKLEKGLYGLKQAGRLWYKKLDEELQGLGFIRMKSENCLYILVDKEKEAEIYILTYVDDLILAARSREKLIRLKERLMKIFKMKELGNLNFILGIEVIRNREKGEIKLSQRDYIKTILKRFNAENLSSRVSPLDSSLRLLKTIDGKRDEKEQKNYLRVNQKLYQMIIGSLMYLALGTRPDITFAVTYLSQFSSDPSIIHLVAAERVLRYVNGTKSFMLNYRRSREKTIDVKIYCDSDWGGSLIDRKSFSGYVFSLGGGAFSWSSKKQSTVALSSVEAEYMAAVHCSKQVIWFKNLIEEMNIILKNSLIVFSDSQGSIAMGKNNEQKSRSKHIDIKYYFIKDMIEKEILSFSYLETEKMIADFLTKAISAKQQTMCLNGCGLFSDLIE